VLLLTRYISKISITKIPSTPDVDGKVSAWNVTTSAVREIRLDNHRAGRDVSRRVAPRQRLRRHWGHAPQQRADLWRRHGTAADAAS
jgi:hypothetical protein